MTTPPPLLASLAYGDPVEAMIIDLRAEASVFNDAGMSGTASVCSEAADMITAASVCMKAIAAEKEALETALSASVGHMLNAMIGLDAGGTKAAAIKTLESGITLARATLNGAPQP